MHVRRERGRGGPESRHQEREYTASVHGGQPRSHGRSLSLNTSLMPAGRAQHSQPSQVSLTCPKKCLPPPLPGPGSRSQTVGGPGPVSETPTLRLAEHSPQRGKGRAWTRGGGWGQDNYYEESASQREIVSSGVDHT